MIRIKIFNFSVDINTVKSLFSAVFSLKNGIISLDVYKNYKISVMRLKLNQQNKWKSKEYILFKGFYKK